MQLPKLYAQNTVKGAIDLTLSVNPLGCSPLVLKKLRTITMRDISTYPSPNDLTIKLAARFGIKRENILIGNGSEQLIKLIAQSFIKPRDRICIERGSFGLFVKESLLAKGNIILTPLDKMAITKAKLIFLANPKTPSGEVIPKQVLKQIQQNMSKGLLIVDEANGELIDKSSIEEAVKSPNVLVLRTFSKAFGLAGLRIGLVIGSVKIINKLKNVQQAFPVSQIAINLAISALKDQAFLIKTRNFITDERLFLQKELSKRRLEVSNSVTNNLFITFAQADTLIKELNKRGVSVINGTFFPGMSTPGFRISLKDRKTNILFLKKLDEALDCLNNKKLIRSRKELI